MPTPSQGTFHTSPRRLKLRPKGVSKNVFRGKRKWLKPSGAGTAVK
jgi:hypothetical protein